MPKDGLIPDKGNVLWDQSDSFLELRLVFPEAHDTVKERRVTE